MDLRQVLAKITDKTRAVFLTHVLGFNALNEAFLNELKQRNIPLLEDVCESHGATYQNRRLGTFGLASNFSFYYAHHLSTMEGGMICTSDTDFYETVRMLRSHGMVRELDSASRRREYRDDFPDLNPDFIFAYPGFNVRGTEIQAVIGRSQLPRLEDNIARRNENFSLFLQHLDPAIYRTDFACEGCSNYAFTLILREPNEALCPPHHGEVKGTRRRISPRHLRRRQSTATAVFASPSGSRCLERLSAGRSCAFLRDVHRQLSEPERGTRFCGCVNSSIDLATRLAFARCPRER